MSLQFSLKKCSVCGKLPALVSPLAVRDENSPHFVYCWHCRKRTQITPSALHAFAEWNGKNASISDLSFRFIKRGD